MNCPGCHRDNDPKRRYCGKCGHNLDPVCKKCSFANEREDRFCGGCGENMTVAPAGAVRPAVMTAAAVPGVPKIVRPAAVPPPPPPAPMPVAPAKPVVVDELAGLFTAPAVASEPAKLPDVGIGQDDLDRLFGVTS
ncbi:MAG: zinc ribbon domain-containing protein [Kofleriaceae bacterium]